MASTSPKIKGAARNPGGIRVAYGAATLVARNTQPTFTAFSSPPFPARLTAENKLSPPSAYPGYPAPTWSRNSTEAGLRQQMPTRPKIQVPLLPGRFTPVGRPLTDAPHRSGTTASFRPISGLLLQVSGLFTPRPKGHPAPLTPPANELASWAPPSAAPSPPLGSVSPQVSN